MPRSLVVGFQVKVIPIRFFLALFAGTSQKSLIAKSAIQITVAETDKYPIDHR